MIRISSTTLKFLCTTACLLCMSAPASGQSIASLGSVNLTAKDITQLTLSQPELRPQILASDQTLESVVRQELLRRALVAEAKARGWDQRPDILKTVEAATEQVILNTYLNRIAQVPQDYPDEAATKAFFEANQAGLQVPNRYHLAQIFIARPAGNEAGSAEKRAADISARARKDGADFAAIAKSESGDAASRDKGGDIGWVVETNVAPAIRAILPQLRPGSVSGAVATSNGWHIVKLIELKPQAPATLEEARPAIVQRLRAERATQLRAAYVQELLKNAPPKIDTAALSALRGKLK